MIERRRDLPPGAGAPGFILGARNRQSDGGGLRGAAPGGAALAALRCCDRTLGRPPCQLAPLPGLVPSRCCHWVDPPDRCSAVATSQGGASSGR